MTRGAGKRAAIALLAFASAFTGTFCASRSETPPHRPAVLERRPHDPEAFTQGLLIDGDVWLESTGQYGKSELREVRRRDGKVLRRVALSKDQFGEGLASHGGKLYQLTWREKVCLVYDRETLRRVGTFPYRGEGWGLASDGEFLYMSDGGSVIRVLDPGDFTERRRFQVRRNGVPVDRLNELEWVEGELWANLFQTGYIVRIDPEDGSVVGALDLRELPLPSDRHPGQDVLNGIARDPETGDIWVTGKNWKALYRIEWPPEDAD